MALHLDHPQFESMTGAFTHILGQHALQDNNPQVWEQTASGLLYPREVPRYLFRGEGGEFETTMHSLARLLLQAEAGTSGLSKADVAQLERINCWIAGRLCEGLDGLDRPSAFALLQHYGMPTRIVGFTRNLGLAFAFAAMGESSIGRMAVLPYASCHTVTLLELFAHPWAERAQRQAACGVVMTDELPDLKSEAARSRLDIKWYGFRILSSEREFYEEPYRELLREPNDPSAGFLRLHITEYVEANGKLSPTLTEWLLQKVPIAPYCYLLDSVEGNEAVVYYRGGEALLAFTSEAERECSRRYWSSAFRDRSDERSKDFMSRLVRGVGSVIADARTYHPESS
jgi:hypothetical protein